MPLSTSRIAGDTITAADINGIASAVNSKVDGAAIAHAAVLTNESTTSRSFANLATVGPTVTVTIGSSGKALVLLSATIYSTGTDCYAEMSYAVSGASTVAAAEAQALMQNNGGEQLAMSYVVLQEGLTPGSNTFTAKYGAFSTGTANFLRRHITVIPV